MRQKWLLVIAAPTVVLVFGSLAAVSFLPYPIPRAATPAQRAYLTHCATCHGANGQGSWRSTIFLVRPGNLADPRATDGLGDEFLFTLIKHGGAPIGKPGMPAFGYHLSDEEIRSLISHVRALSRRPHLRGQPAPR